MEPPFPGGKKTQPGDLPKTLSPKEQFLEDPDEMNKPHILEFIDDIQNDLDKTVNVIFDESDLFNDSGVLESDPVLRERVIRLFATRIEERKDVVPLMVEGMALKSEIKKVERGIRRLEIALGKVRGM